MECKICSNSNNNKVYQVQEMVFGHGYIFVYFKCSNCGCLQIDEIPNNMSQYYPCDYYSFDTLPPRQLRNLPKNVALILRNSYAVFDKGFIGKLLFDKFPRYDMRSLARCNLTKATRILDVGCGIGLLLSALRDLGFKNSLGIDAYVETDIKYANGVTVLKKTIHEINDQWDLIMFHHSLEHIPDQLETFQSISKLLAEGGICLVRTPNVASYAWEHYGTCWVQLDAPRHFFLHSIKSIELLASKVGLFVENVIYDSTEFQFWGSEQYVKGIFLESEKSYLRDPSKSTFSASEIRLFRQRSRELNLQKQGDSAAFYLRKL